MIRLEKVTWQHGPSAGRERETLANISFAVPQGSFRWLLGPSGAGKSSLLRLLHLEALPRSGTCELLGTSITPHVKRSALARLRQRISMVHQDYRLMPTLSIADNVALPLRLQKRDEDEVAQEVSTLLTWMGLGARQSSRPAELSGGEQQRTAIARAVVSRPAIILADEPTNALDEAQAVRVLTMLRELTAMGTTVIVATHNDALVRRYPAPALHLEHGKLISDE
ncbi:cell division ATP-binding protein FtsE [Acetobacter estunensis]|uniref:cell division ATP-binding protein FtsE n=1 Tax=Acetobacter estunensis TaxID=104097 RepID=UPI001C2D360F|nr:ATP-binding cassette domain-containing protein [Acetobacter estunensis]MBV1838309.1 ATP-binding cassette domain-containing protein [Acetobacter estunensis]